MTFLLSNYQKSGFCIRYICFSSAFRIAIDKYIHAACKYRCLSKEKKIICTTYARCTENMNNVELYFFVCVELCAKLCGFCLERFPLPLVLGMGYVILLWHSLSLHIIILHI